MADGCPFAMCSECGLPIRTGELCQELNFGTIDKYSGEFVIKDTSYYHRGCI